VDVGQLVGAGAVRTLLEAMRMHIAEGAVTRKAAFALLEVLHGDQRRRVAKLQEATRTGNTAQGRAPAPLFDGLAPDYGSRPLVVNGHAGQEVVWRLLQESELARGAEALALCCIRALKRRGEGRGLSCAALVAAAVPLVRAPFLHPTRVPTAMPWRLARWGALAGRVMASLEECTVSTILSCTSISVTVPPAEACPKAETAAAVPGAGVRCCLIWEASNRGDALNSS